MRSSVLPQHHLDSIAPAPHLEHVRYDIRGPLARRAHELESKGFEVLKLNIGNPAVFGFRTPETMRRAMVENLQHAEGYTHQKGIFPAREAVVMDLETKGVRGVSAEDVFIGNGVSELILMCMEALLAPGDEVLLPAPDYPLWTAAVVLAGGKPVYYQCHRANRFVPDPDEVKALVTPRTRAMVLINPNNPTGAVYPKPIVQSLVRIAEERGLVLFSDEIYDRILYDGAVHTPAATMCEGTLCATMGGLSKVYRACGFRVGWVSWSGRRSHATAYLEAVEKLASLRLCSSVPGQWAVQTALGGVQSIEELTAPSGRLGRQRQSVIDGCARSKYLDLLSPEGAMYAFPRIRTEELEAFNDASFAMRLLEEQRVLIVPGSSFNVSYNDHVRLTLLPSEEVMAEVFARMEKCLDGWERRR